MTSGPGDKGQSQPPKTPEPSAQRRQPAQRQTIWPDRADMVSNNNAANQMFKQNAERLQKAAESRREQQVEQPSQSKTAAPAPGQDRNYAAIKREHAVATPSPGGNGPERAQTPERRPLTFVKDRERGAGQDLKPEPAKEAGESPRKGLTFVKDHERGARQSLKAETSKGAGQTPGKGLTFVKDQSQGIDRSR